MGLFRGLANLVTLGGYGKLKDAEVRYHRLYAEYKSLFKHTDSIRQEVNKLVEQIGSEMQRSLDTLAKAAEILAQNSCIETGSKNRKVDFTVSLQMIDSLKTSSLSGAEVAAASAATQGITLGSAMALGSWALVSTFGAATTGTAISTLSGAAATKATLAWFGGGAIAAGGMGMMGGTALLGGLVLLPMILISAKKLYKNAEDIENVSKRIEDEMPKLHQYSGEVKTARNNVALCLKQIAGAHNQLKSSVSISEKKLFGFMGLSRFTRKLLRFLGRKFYSEKELEILIELEHAVKLFLHQFNTHANTESNSVQHLMHEKVLIEK